MSENSHLSPQWEGDHYRPKLPGWKFGYGRDSEWGSIEYRGVKATFMDCDGDFVRWSVSILETNSWADPPVTEYCEIAQGETDCPLAGDTEFVKEMIEGIVISITGLSQGKPVTYPWPFESEEN